MKSLAILFAAALCACAAPAAQRFPIGIYGVERPEDLVQIRNAGFDAFQTYLGDRAALAALAKEAGRQGLRMLAAPDELLKAGDSAPAWPLLAWYLQDEPDVNDVTPEALAAKERRVRSWDHKGKEAFVVGQGSAAARYASSGDAFMLDWYPVPHLALDSVADQLDEVRLALPDGKPLWMVLQAFDWRDYPQHGDGKKPRIGRFPTHGEMRFMTYLAVLHGASGLFYFTLNDPAHRPLYARPALWQALETVIDEARAMRPIWVDGRRMPLPFAVDPDGPESACWRFHGRDYFVLLNRRADVSLKVPDETLRSSWRPLFESRRDPREVLQKFGEAYYLKPHQVLVLESRPWRTLR